MLFHTAVMRTSEQTIAVLWRMLQTKEHARTDSIYSQGNEKRDEVTKAMIQGMLLMKEYNDPRGELTISVM